MIPNGKKVSADGTAAGPNVRRAAGPSAGPLGRSCTRLVLTTTNDNLKALRFYQKRGFRLRALRPGAVDEARRTLKPGIPAVGDLGIPLRDELDLERIL